MPSQSLVAMTRSQADTVVGEVIGSGSSAIDSLHIANLEAQIGVLRDHSQALLSTVQWTLATIVGVAVILVGYNWFVVRRDVDRERRDMQTALNTGIAAAKAELQKAVAEAKDALEADTYDQAHEAADIAVSGVKGALAIAEERIGELAVTLLEHKAHYWELRGVPANELDQYRHMLALAAEHDNEIGLLTALEGLQRLLRQGHKIFWAYVPDVVEILEGLPQRYSASADAIRELCREHSSG